MNITEQVVRERKTETELRRMDAHETVDWIHRLEDETAERDAEIAQLKALLKEARDDIADCAADTRGRRSLYSSEQRRYKKHMDIVQRIDAALAGEDKS